MSWYQCSHIQGLHQGQHHGPAALTLEGRTWGSWAARDTEIHHLRPGKWWRAQMSPGQLSGVVHGRPLGAPQEKPADMEDAVPMS